MNKIGRVRRAELRKGFEGARPAAGYVFLALEMANRWQEVVLAFGRVNQQELIAPRRQQPLKGMTRIEDEEFMLALVELFEVLGIE